MATPPENDPEATRETRDYNPQAPTKDDRNLPVRQGPEQPNPDEVADPRSLEEEDEPAAAEKPDGPPPVFGSVYGDKTAQEEIEALAEAKGVKGQATPKDSEK